MITYTDVLEDLVDHDSRTIITLSSQARLSSSEFGKAIGLVHANKLERTQVADVPAHGTTYQHFVVQLNDGWEKLVKVGV